jgi:hypothetical protein
MGRHENPKPYHCKQDCRHACRTAKLTEHSFAPFKSFCVSGGGSFQLNANQITGKATARQWGESCILSRKKLSFHNALVYLNPRGRFFRKTTEESDESA